MAGQKYYLDEQGLIKVLQNISNEINQKTSPKITFTNVENPETGEIIQELNNSDNFPTVGAVYDYIKNQSKQNLTINIQSAVPENDGYNIQTDVSKYNGNEAAQININLVQYTDIQQLFI